MLSHGRIGSASGAANYYASDNYYTEHEQTEASEWFGKAAEAIGLTGQVDARVFENILAGRRPDGALIAGFGKDHRPGFDLSFSVPKGLSLMALVGGDTRLIDAHRGAVKATLAWAENRFSQARMGKDGRVTVQTGALVVALFHHDTSRAMEPNLHSHAIVANMTLRADGQLRALKNDNFYAQNLLLGALYHNELRTRVAALGYEIEGGGKNGMFDIKGLSRDTVMAWSSRSAQINAIAEKLGVTSPEAKGAIALRTRDSKVEMAPDILRQSWQDLAAARGHDFAARIATQAVPKAERGLLDKIKTWGETLLDRVMPFWRPQPEPMVGDHAQLRQSERLSAAYAVASAVRHLGERQATFRTYDVLRESLNFAAQNANIASIEARINTLIARGALILGTGRHADRVTTPDMIKTEREIVSFAKPGQGQIETGRSEAVAHRLIQAASQTKLGFALSTAQLRAATQILYGEDRVVAVQGDSGTGKSTIFTAIEGVPLIERPGLAMLTTQSGLARTLAAESGIETHTLGFFLTRFEKLAATRRAATPQEKADYADKTLIVDEASMVSSRQMLGLFRIADKLGIARIALVGDRQQIPSVDAGRPFALLQDTIGAERLRENVRQNDPEMKAAIARLGRGDIAGAFALLGDRVVESKTPADAAAAAWLKLDPAVRETTAIFTSGHRLRGQALDALVLGQGADRASTKLSVFENLNLSREHMRHAQHYGPGMQLDLHRHQPALGLEKGSYSVEAVDLATGKVAVARGGQRTTIEPQKLHPNAAGLSLSIPKEIEVREGERLMATANVPDRGINNGDRFMLKAIEGDRLRLEDRSGRDLLVEPSDPMRARLDHGDALNMHRAQGLTVGNAITVLSSDDRLLNSKSLAYVLSSRARDGFVLYVDDKARVIEQIERNDEYTPHASDFAPELQNEDGAKDRDAAQLDERSKQSSNAPDTHKPEVQIKEPAPVRELTRDYDFGMDM